MVARNVRGEIPKEDHQPAGTLQFSAELRTGPQSDRPKSTVVALENRIWAVDPSYQRIKSLYRWPVAGGGEILQYLGDQLRMRPKVIVLHLVGAASTVGV